jgi:ABC-2 type transport system ATP-binding protein
MNAPVIHVEGLHKRYGANEVLRGVDLSVAEGEFFGLVGVNGAGKTTLIKCLLDFIAVDAGAVRLFGVPATDSRARGGLAFLPEKFTPPYYLTGRDFLRYMSELYAMDFVESALIGLLRVVDMDAAALGKPVRQLSKGMAQKLGVLAALLAERPLLVMDEPMSGLDPKVRALLKSHLLSLKSRTRTLFFSTHLLHDVEALCDRLAILHGGRVAFVGSPAECCRAFGVDSLEQAYLACVETSSSSARDAST